MRLLLSSFLFVSATVLAGESVTIIDAYGPRDQSPKTATVENLDLILKAANQKSVIKSLEHFSNKVSGHLKVSVDPVVILNTSAQLDVTVYLEDKVEKSICSIDITKRVEEIGDQIAQCIFLEEKSI